MFHEISFCSQIVRKKRNQQPSIARKLLIFNQLSYKSCKSVIICFAGAKLN